MAGEIDYGADDECSAFDFVSVDGSDAGSLTGGPDLLAGGLDLLADDVRMRAAWRLTFSHLIWRSVWDLSRS